MQQSFVHLQTNTSAVGIRNNCNSVNRSDISCCELKLDCFTAVTEVFTKNVERNVQFRFTIQSQRIVYPAICRPVKINKFSGVLTISPNISILFTVASTECVKIEFKLVSNRFKFKITFCNTDFKRFANSATFNDKNVITDNKVVDVPILSRSAYRQSLYDATIDFEVHRSGKRRWIEYDIINRNDVTLRCIFRIEFAGNDCSIIPRHIRNDIEIQFIAM